MYIPAEIEIPGSPARAAQKIYATHAAGKEISILPQVLSELDAILIDIRLTPPAQPLKWSKNYLELLIGNKYLHVPLLGNRAAEAGGATTKSSIQNLALGIKIITELKINILLFCSCQNESNCHRRAVSREIVKHGSQITEIADWLCLPKNC